MAQGATIAFGLQASTLRTDRRRRCTEGLWCKWRGPIGYADQRNWLRSAMIKLKVSEELFKGRHWEAVSARTKGPFTIFISCNSAGAHLSSSAIAAMLPKLRIRGS